MRRLRLLWVTPFLPRRGVSAAQARWWALLHRIAARHDVSLLAFVTPDEAAAAGELPDGLAARHLVPRRPWRPEDPLALLPRTVAGGYTDPALRAAVAERLAAEPFDLVQYEFVEMANLAPASGIPSILTVHQLGFAQEGPLWRAEGRPVARGAVLFHRYLRELDFELRAVLRADRVVTMSAEDAARLQRFHPRLRIAVSPCGVDTREFHPLPPRPPEVDLVFLGHFAHPPNVDAARFLVREVLPGLGRPVRLRIVGRGVTPEIASLADDAAIEVTGGVDDVRPHLAAGAVFVAPIRFGTGMRGKLLEALAMGRPVVTTPVGAEGLGAVAGRDLLVADGARDFAAAVRRLLDEPAVAARLGAAGRALVTARFDWDAIATAHEGIYEAVLRDGASAQPPKPAPASRIAGSLGYLPGVGAGFTLLAVRALRWHLRRLGQRPRLPVLGDPSPLRSEGAG